MPTNSGGINFGVGGALLRPAKVRPRDVDTSLYEAAVAAGFAKIGKRVGPKQVKIWAAKFGAYKENIINAHAYANKGNTKSGLDFAPYFLEKTKPPGGGFWASDFGQFVAAPFGVPSPYGYLAAAYGNKAALNDINNSGLVKKLANIVKNPSGPGAFKLAAAVGGAVGGNVGPLVNEIFDNAGGGSSGFAGSPYYNYSDPSAGLGSLPVDPYSSTLQNGGIPGWVWAAALVVGGFLLVKVAH